MQHPPNIPFILSVAQYYLHNHSTVRETAQHFDISKSTVHNYLTIYLPHIDHKMSKSVNNLLQHNFKIKHLRGGDATRQKYLSTTNIK